MKTGNVLLSDAEESVDGQIADAVAAFLTKLQSERDRIVQLATRACSPSSSLSPASISFRKSDEFDALLARIIATPFGSLDVVEQTVLQPRQNSSDTSMVSGSSSGLGSMSSSSPSSASPSSTTRRRSSFERMEVVAIVEGDDLLGQTVRQPTAITMLPRTNCVAFIHNSSRISLLSSSTRILATFDLYTNAVRGSCSLRKGCLTADPLSGQLFCVEQSSILSMKPSGSRSFACPMQAKVNVAPIRDSTFGLAVCPQTRQIFTASGDDFVSYSLVDWSVTNRARIRAECDRFTSNVLAFSDMPDETVENQHNHVGRVFYSGANRTSLNAVPIDRNGVILADEAKVISNGFRDITGIAFDPDGNILVADKGRGRIEVLTPSGESMCCFAPTAGAFNPSGVAILTSPSPFVFDKIRCSRLVIAPDNDGNRIFFFASPDC